MKEPSFKNERVWTSYVNKNGEIMFVITAKNHRDFYYLYEATKNGFIKLGKGKSPIELEEKYKIEEKMKNFK